MRDVCVRLTCSLCPTIRPSVRSFVALQKKNIRFVYTRTLSHTQANTRALSFFHRKLCVKKNSSAFISVFLSFFRFFVCAVYRHTHSLTHTCATYRTLCLCSKFFRKYLHAERERSAMCIAMWPRAMCHTIILLC